MNPKAIGYSSSYLSNNTENHKKGERKCAKFKKKCNKPKKDKTDKYTKNMVRIGRRSIPCFLMRDRGGASMDISKVALAPHLPVADVDEGTQNVLRLV